MDKKKIYETPVVVIVAISRDDIITMSPGSDNDGNIPDEWMS